MALKLLAFFAMAAVPSEAFGPRVIMEPAVAGAVGHAPNWLRAGQALPHELVRPIFMLRHSTEVRADLERTFWEVSDPDSAHYGKHLSRAEVARRFAPQPQALETLLGWLSSHGVSGPNVSVGLDMVEAAIPVGTAEAMFETTLHHFVHRSHGVDLVRAARGYTVPAEVAEVIYLVGDLVQLPALGGPRIVESPPEESAEFPNGCSKACAGKVTPDVLKQAYMLGVTPGGQNTSMAVAEFQGVSYDTTDNQYFQQVCALLSPVKVARQVGSNHPLTCKVPVIGSLLCTEALLDVQYIKAVAGDIPLTAVSDLRYSLLTWAKQLEGLTDLPLVHSVSYGNDEVQQTSTEFMDAVNVQFMKLGVRGVSILFASGDQGVYGRTGVTADGKFHPDFPAASPYVTAVGGTDFAQKSVVGEERAWSAGGGGFSSHFPAPAYQRAAVSSYLAKAGAAGKLPKASAFNRQGRGYPDVAALGGEVNPYCVAASLLFKPRMTGVAGTSASCPVVAGIVARLNALRAGRGMPAMGFLNPFIYRNPGAFNDVTLGENSGGGPQGFQALPGWDPATGFGSPNFPKLAAAALASIPAREPAEATVVV